MPQRKLVCRFDSLSAYVPDRRRASPFIAVLQFAQRGDNASYGREWVAVLGEGGGAQGQREAGGALAEGGETDREGLSGMATVRRRDLTEAVCDEVGLVHGDAAELVDGFIEAIAERLSAGEEVKISSFGSFTVRDKGARMGRNPKTGEPAAILPRRVVVFRPSAKLKERIKEMLGDGGEDA